MADGIAAASRGVGAAKAAVALTDVVVSFRVAVGTYTAIDRATLNVGDGEFVAIVGPTGCGKST
ncbi:MAG TPA: ABC transporter ATP-binding protein, partial [Pseudolabrys sp.]